MDQKGVLHHGFVLNDLDMEETGGLMCGMNGRLGSGHGGLN